MFIESLFDANENGQSPNFHSGMKCNTYNGFYSGYFLELFGGNRKVEDKTLHLVGATIYSDFDFLKGMQKINNPLSLTTPNLFRRN